MRRFALALAILAVLLLLLSGPGVRLGLWPFTVGILALVAAGLIGALAALAAMIGLSRSRSRQAGVIGLVLALLMGMTAASVPAAAFLRARSVPPINDISTDIENPPQGKEAAELQRQAYPDIQPLRLPVAPNIAFERAKGAVEEMGWQIVAEHPSAGRIEAVATTFWFGFKDDVAIRVTADGKGSRIDVRSKSRVGRGDLGTNARRIRDFSKALELK
jgi:uncharacterized protein (DUF1499 family)